MIKDALSRVLVNEQFVLYLSITDAEKVQFCKDNGAIGVIILNSKPGPFIDVGEVHETTNIRLLNSPAIVWSTTPFSVAVL